MMRVKHPELGTLDQFEEWLQEKIVEAHAIGYAKKEASYTLPVVVHVIHNGQNVGVGMNISDAQIKSQIDVLNEDFRKWNLQISQLSEDPYDQTNWATLAADCQINFCLAKNDPAGNTMSSPGIDRVNRNTKGFEAPPYSDDYIDDVIKPATIWDPNKYFNIWVVDFSVALVGYATFPSASTLSGLNANFGTSSSDGIVIAYRAFGRVGNVAAPYNMGKSAVHEVGHWLGLRHIWGDNDCATDYCNDTPSQEGPNTGPCADFPHVTCNNGPNGDMFINYMDYSRDNCVVMFTNDQKTRMQTVMANSPFRVALATQSANCGPLEISETEVSERINLYPNPSSAEINISLPYQKILSVDVLNVLGEFMFSQTVNKSTDHIMLNDHFLSNGIYMLRVNSENDRVVKQLVIKR